ncbi:MAG: hypothetical protein ACRDJ3_10305, partial [Solirubrobacteraceae bacterium]
AGTRHAAGTPQTTAQAAPSESQDNAVQALETQTALEIPAVSESQGIEAQGPEQADGVAGGSESGPRPAKARAKRAKGAKQDVDAKQDQEAEQDDGLAKTKRAKAVEKPQGTRKAQGSQRAKKSTARATSQTGKSTSRSRARASANGKAKTSDASPDGVLAETPDQVTDAM